MTQRLEPPHITSWSTESYLPDRVVERYGRLAYEVEQRGDRDDHGVLWYRTKSSHGQGQPEFKKVHPQRQREAMSRLLCQVCAGPADQTADGVLWLLPMGQDEWDGWPERCAATEPPVCRRCARRAIQQCPALRKLGAVIVRARKCPIIGVRGALYEPASPSPRPVEHILARYSCPEIGWIHASALVRELRDCTTFSSSELDDL